MRPIRVVIADDENPARRKVQRFLSSEDDFEVVGEAATGPEAVRQINQTRPDLVFLDVQMPGQDGFEVIESLEHQPSHLVFVTAYDQFALKAFEVHALDYLLKPFDQARFQQVLQRVRTGVTSGRDAREMASRLETLIKELRTPRVFAERMLVSAGDTAVFLQVDDIDWIEGARNYLTLHSKQRTYLIRSTIEGLCQKLDPAKFLRANRSQVVNLSRIRELQPWFHGEYRIRLVDGTEISWTRRYLDRHSDLIIRYK